MGKPFAIQKVFENSKDIQRNYLFDVTIPDMGKYGIKDNDLLIRARTAVIPQRGNENTIESVFMGMKRFFPGKPTFSHILTVTFEEFEDRAVSTAMYNWQQDLYDIEQNGAALVASKKDITRTITLQMYGWNGDPINGGASSKIEFFNAWVQDVGEVALDYSSAEAVKYAVVFQYDRWQLKK